MQHYKVLNHISHSVQDSVITFELKLREWTGTLIVNWALPPVTPQLVTSPIYTTNNHLNTI